MKLYDTGVFFHKRQEIYTEKNADIEVDKQQAEKNTKP